SANHHRLCIDVTVHHGAVAEIQHSIGLDFTVDFSVKRQLARKLEVPFDFDVRSQCIFCSACSIHIVSLFLSGTRFWRMAREASKDLSKKFQHFGTSYW